MRTLLNLLVCALPWRLRRYVLRRLHGYDIHPTSRIGLAWVFPQHLVMGPNSAVGHLTVVKGLELLSLDESATIGRLNWITAYPLGRPPHFSHLPNRRPRLSLGAHAAITHRHIIDCTEQVSIGRFSTFAGFRSQILTHSIDLVASRQDAKPVTIGDYCFVGTACTILGGSTLPGHCVLGARALLNAAHTEEYRLYAGVPAKPVAPLDAQMAYFSRTRGFIE